MEKLSIAQVAELLKKEGFSEDVVDLFTDNAIDGKALKMLKNHEHMKELGLRKMGDRLKLEDLISNYKENADTNELPQAEPPTEISEMQPGELASSVTCQPRKMYIMKFNTIVSGFCWGWDNTSQLFICLSPPELGGIESCHRLESQLLGSTAEGLLYFKGYLEIPHHIIMKYAYIYYHYAARTSRTGGSIVPEYIWNVSTKKSVYRCIEIPSLQQRPGGVWEQWDTIVYPKEAETPHGVKVAPEGLLEFLAQKVVQNISAAADDDTTRQQIPDDPENQELADERCLYIYLQAHQKRLLDCDLSSSVGISEMVDTVQKILDQLQNRKYGLLSTSGPADRSFFTRFKWNSSQRLTVVMGQWVMSIVKRLQTTRICNLEQWSVDARKVCLVSAIAVLCIAHETITLPQLSEQNCVRMSNLLRESYRPEKRECPACILEEHISTEQFRDNVVKPALKSLALTILQKSSDKNWRWLQVVPLFHFMARLSCPFKAVPLDKEIKWNFWVELLNARKKQSFENYTDILGYVQDLLDLDYQFAKVMLFLCPHKDLVVILQKVDPILSTGFYTWYVKNYGREYIIKAKDPEVVHQHLEAIYVSHVKESDSDAWQRKSIYFTNNAHGLMNATMEELAGISESHCEILYYITRHVLSIMSLKFSEEHGDRVTLEDLDEFDRPSKVVETIGQWLQSKAGVGHVKFGGMQLKKYDEEVRVWRVLCRDSICNHANIKRHWIKATNHLLMKRAKMVEDKAMLVSRSDQKKLDTPEQVKETLIRLATDELMSPSLPENELSRRVNKLVTHKHSSGNVSELLSQVLICHLNKQDRVKVKNKDTYRVLKQGLTINDLISWKVWAIMMKITCDPQQSELFSNMTEDAKKVCKAAHNVLQVTCDQIVAGNYILNELKVISKKKKEVQLLCSEAAIKNFNLEKWLGHLEAVVAYIGKVQEFHNRLDSGVKDYEALQEELHTASIKTMIELCPNWNDVTSSADLQFTCCPTIQPCTQSILTPFYLLYKESEIFRSIWKNKLVSNSLTPPFTQVDVVELVWIPAVTNCLTLIRNLKSGRILLSEVKRVFRQQKIGQSCHSLVDALSSCFSVKDFSDTFSLETFTDLFSDKSWIDTVCRQCEHYTLSLKCIECAQALLALRDKLRLKGDFSHIQLLGDKDSSKLEKLTLCDVTELFQDDIKTLHGISDPNKVNVLKALVDSWTFVEWIKEFESTINVQGFVDLALDTSDANDMTNTMLTDLRTIGSAICEFMFTLPNPCGLNELVAACKDLWKGSFDYRTLQACADQLGFFINLKTTQGSLERRTIDEITKINEFGQIIVGKPNENIYQDSSEVISVRVLASDEHTHPTKEYTFQELENLISLIVLITGKNKKAENRSGMQRFLELFRKACQIAEVLIAMHQKGYMESIGDCYCYLCKDTSVDELNKKATRMKKELIEWNMLVENARRRYYPLNSFTNKQLCLLRRELYNPNGLKCEVMCLLNALLPCTSDSEITKAVHESWQHLSSSPSAIRVSRQPRASNSESSQNYSVSDEKTKNALEIEQLVESEVLKPIERDNYRNLTESQKAEPLLALLAILKSSADKKYDFLSVLDMFEEIELTLVGNQKLKIADINKLINEFLSKRPSDSVFFLKEEEEKVEEELILTDSSESSFNTESSRKKFTLSPSTINLSLSSDEYLTLDQLGELLQEVVNDQKEEHVHKPREFKGIDFKKGYPNLIVTKSDNILTCAMMLYAEDNEMPLPTQEEVLICTSQTTAEEVTLLWRRAIGDPGFKRIFCLVHAEKLSYLVSEECVRSLLRLKDEKIDYRLVIICSKEDDKHCYVIENLHAYMRTSPDVQLEQYLTLKCCNPNYKQLGVPPLASDCAGWKVDDQRSFVRVVQSSRVGMGKSLYITERAQELADKFGISDSLVTVRVHGPKIAEERIMDQLQSLGARSNDPLIVHFDIAPSMIKAVDCFLFSILVLGYFTDRRGKLWRRKYSHLYMIELTQPTSEENASFATTNLVKFFPSHNCLSPVDMVAGAECHLKSRKWSTELYQLVHYYLKHYDPSRNTQNFLLEKFKDPKIPRIIGSNKDFLQCIFHHYTATTPSWRELEYFILFLSTQLSAFEHSEFCDTGYMSTALPGMRSLVMKMVMRMSKEFTLPSLRDDDTAKSSVIQQQEEISTYRWRKWNESFHPYLFFNQDNISFTFIGFNITENGDAVDPATSEVIEPKIMSAELRTALMNVDKDVDLLEDYREWKRNKQLQKLATVIGLNPQAVKDPDPSYVLTVDNVIKILAIVMRLRCRIPVIIMGETGCGKTQLLRFLCSLIAQALPIEGSFQNFVSVKIHGGTSEKTIEEAVKEAENCANKNSKLIHELEEKVKKEREEREKRQAIEAVETFKTKGAKGVKKAVVRLRRAEESTTLHLDGTKLGTILFFDEANTTDHVDLIKEIMCDHTLYGRRIHKDVRVVAACNPYRLLSKKMIKKLESAGLGFRMKAKEMLASSDIPLRHLVYRVHDLPTSMKTLVYDFGELNDDAEKKYICEIVKKHVSKQGLCEVIANILNLSQKFIKKTKDECSYVSLRDVDRAMIVFKFFYDKSQEIGTMMHKLAIEKNKTFIQCDITRAVLLALAVCYYTRLQEPRKRKDFAVMVSAEFKDPLHTLPSHMFVEHFQCCQKVFLNSMGAIGQNIAHNRALCENVMMMVVCINLRIPLFLIGKPGSSKSLAKTIISNSMRGTAPSNEFLKNFKEVQMFSYQCSQLSTSDSILNVFHQAEAIQSKKQDKSNFVSVVVLDEVGLAEDSPSLPLKVLHPLLEDGTKGNSYSVEVVDRENRVAFIGISNWALDPAKMNRGIMVTRCDPDERELTESASQICTSGADDDVVAEWLRPCFRHFATAYLEIVKKQTGDIRKEFFGLRDFYSMVKMLYWMCKAADCPPNKMQIDHVVLRNFSGYEGFDPLEVFNKTALINFSPPKEIKTQFKEDETALEPVKTKFMELNAEWLPPTDYAQPSADMSKEEYLLLEFKKQLHLEKFSDSEIQKCYDAEYKKYFHQKVENKIWPLIHPDCSPAGLIKASLANKERSYHGENRYLLLLTESYAALQTLQHFFEVNYQMTEAQNNCQSESGCAAVERQPPLILFGSSFPKDKHFTQVYRHINTIKICMETGRTVVLLNLEEVYESLYDALNQYYQEYGAGTRFVDLGLQTHRIKCRVHDDFKLILIAEKKVVYNQFPTPLINRLEKHIVDTSTVLNERQMVILGMLKTWIENFNSLDNHDIHNKFQPCDSFIGYQADTPSAVVLTASRENGMTEEQIELDPQKWEQEVFQSCKSRLLEMASPDALIRLRSTPLVDEQRVLCEIYMKKQHHSSLEAFIKFHISSTKSNMDVLMQATTYNQLLSAEEIESLEKTLELPKGHVVSCHLQQFDTESSFTSSVKDEYKKLDQGDVFFIVQCDSGHINGDLIACAKYRLEDVIHEESKIYQLQQFDTFSPGLEEPTAVSQSHQLDRKMKGRFFALFTVYLPRKHGHTKSSFVSFLGGDWKCTHIDNFFPIHSFFSPVSALACGEEQMTLSQLFHMIYIDTLGCEFNKLYIHIQQAVEKAGHLPTGITAGRMKTLNKTLLKLLQYKINKEFCNTLVEYIYHNLKTKEQSGKLKKDWIFEEAKNSLNLQSGGAFINVILRRLDSEIINAFSAIIAVIDTNYNLELLVDNSHFWLDAFKHKRVSDIWEQGDMESANKTKFACSQYSFICGFPFSFVLQDPIERQWKIEVNKLGKNPQKLFTSLCSVMQTSLSSIGDLFNSVPETCHVEMGRLYIMDLISATLPSSLQDQTLRDRDKEIVLATLEPEACLLIQEENPPTFSQVIVALHIAYHLREDEISRFKKLTIVMAEILNHIKGYYDEMKPLVSDKTWKLKTDAWSLGPDVLAVREILAQLTLESKLEPNEKRLVTQMRCYYGVKQLVDQTLNSKPKEDVKKLRLEWQKLQVVYKFIEHVILENTAENHELLAYLVPYAKRLIIKFKMHADFAKVDTTELLEKTLSVMHMKLKAHFRSQLKQIEESCITFYIDVISSLCFGQAGPPDEKLVDKLLQTVFTASKESGAKTSKLTPFLRSPDDDASGDDVPVIRSFLLQLLFRDSSGTVRKHIDKFFVEARCACEPTTSSAFRSVALMYCQCFEDSLYQKLATTPKNDQFAFINQVMKESFDSIMKNYVENVKPEEMDQQVLEAVGGLRFALKFAADCISQKINHASSTAVSTWLDSEVKEFLDMTKWTCQHHLLKLTKHKPRLFLLKLLYRRHGSVVVDFCTEKESDFVCLVSDQAKGLQQKLGHGDPYVIYSQYCGDVQTAIKDVLKTGDTHKLEVLQLPATDKLGPLMTLSFLSLSCHQYCNPHSDTEMTCLEPYIVKSSAFSEQLKAVTFAVIHNSFCGSLPELEFSETQSLLNRQISTLMVHIVTVVFARQDQHLVQPFVCMVLNTSALQDMFMPAMPDPSCANTQACLGGVFLECPSKHTCFVYKEKEGLEGSPEPYSCPDCGKTILSKNDNKRQKSTSGVKGYTLGLPLPYQPSPVRGLSPVAAIVMRVLMHSVLLWTSCNKDDDDIKNIQNSIQYLNVREEFDVPKFFYNHLREDLQALGQFLSINGDDVILLMHLIAKTILYHQPPLDCCNELLKEDDRRAWEEMFNASCILPVIQNVPSQIAQARTQMFKDEGEEQLRLYQMVYKADENLLSLTGDLWAFRPILNLEHVSQSLKALDNPQKHILLAYFLDNEPMIRATQYLPSILKLQQYLLGKHHHHSSHEHLKDEKIVNVISDADNDRSMQVKEMVECTRRAWNLVKGRLYTHGFLKLPKDSLAVAFSDEESVELLLPRPSGLGIYSYALVAHLVYAHNEFIDLCSEIVVKRGRHNYQWWKQTINLEDVQPFHLVQYEDKLMSIIMAHCHYSLRTGEDVSYHFDFQGLEKQFLNECVYGKPHIEVKELPHMVYHKDVYTAQKFEEIKRKVPQVALSSDIKKKIIKHVKEPHQLRAALDHIDMVLGFLAASSGVNPLTTLKEYAQNMLEIEEFNELAMIGEWCRLQHVLSLWETVSLELAKQLTVNGNDPFYEVKKCFHKPLQETLIVKLKASLPHISIGLSSLLNTLNVFIETHIRNVPREEAGEKLVTRLAMMYEDMGDLEQRGFPGEIKLCHVVSVWQHVIKYDQELQKTLK